MLEERLQQIRLVLLDVDGVLTGGEIIYSDNGEQIKVFDVKDGLGIRMLKNAGIEVGIITGRTGKALRHRCDNLGIELVFDGVRDKVRVLETIVQSSGITSQACAFIGDDLPDWAIMRQVGCAVAVADAHTMIRQIAHMITRAPGGRGAVREVSEVILKAQDKWAPTLEKLFNATQ